MVIVNLLRDMKTSRPSVTKIKSEKKISWTEISKINRARFKASTYENGYIMTVSRWEYAQGTEFRHTGMERLSLETTFTGVMPQSSVGRPYESAATG